MEFDKILGYQGAQEMFDEDAAARAEEAKLFRILLVFRLEDAGHGEQVAVEADGADQVAGVVQKTFAAQVRWGRIDAAGSQERLPVQVGGRPASGGLYRVV